jgi:hypothetical protein
VVLNYKRRICHVFPRFTSRFIPEPGKQTGHSFSGALLCGVTVIGGHFHVRDCICVVYWYASCFRIDALIYISIPILLFIPDPNPAFF